MARRVEAYLLLLLTLNINNAMNQDLPRRTGRLQEVFAWTQLTYNVDGNLILGDRESSVDPLGDVTGRNERRTRDVDGIHFTDSEEDRNKVPDLDARSNSIQTHHGSNQGLNKDQRPNTNQWFNMNQGSNMNQKPNTNKWFNMNRRPNADQRPASTTPGSTTTTNSNVNPERNQFFIQYNNVPMGVERHQNRLFITLPRRRYGILSTLNYLDLTQDSRTRSPSLRPYPDFRRSRSLVSVYRTRVDECNRLWMVDTGMLEIPNERQQVQPPAIVVFDLSTDRQLFRYELKDSDLVNEITPSGFASIRVDVKNNQCEDAYAYLTDLASYGVVVFSLREYDSWRLSTNFFSFNPVAGNLDIAGQRFQWSDGIFSMTLSSPNSQNCKTAYFHALASTQEFSVSTCDLRNRNFANDTDAWQRYSLVGERGPNTQCTTHDYHPQSRVIFYAEIGRNAVSCWQTSRPLVPANVAILAQDSQLVQYPSDLHVTGDEVWVMVNSLPRFNYARLDVNEYNFYIYRGNVSDLIEGTICEPPRPMRKQ